jgi:hypothetical protein
MSTCPASGAALILSYGGIGRRSNVAAGEVVARTATRTGFDFRWRDDDLVTWHGPTQIN